jgi:hypothetical protein
MARKHDTVGSAGGTPGAPQSCDHSIPQWLEVTLEERLRMAECCAFFEAERHRHAEPGHIRWADIEYARAQIDDLIKKCSSAHGSEGT